MGERVSIKCLTLWQPWATAIAEGIKTIETRSWTPPGYAGGMTLFGKPGPIIGIHAGKKMDAEAIFLFGPDIIGKAERESGCLIATVRIKRVYFYRDIGEFEEDRKEHCVPIGWFKKPKAAWELEEIRRIVPIPVRGAMKLWSWEGELEYTKN